MNNWIESVYSDGTINFVSNPTPRLKEKVRIKIRFFKNSPVEKVFFRYITNGELVSLKMNKLNEDDIFSYYYIDLEMREYKYNYRFVLITVEEIYYYNQLSVTNYDPVEVFDFVILADLDYPEWVKSSVFYQIFPDRFFNGDKNNIIKDGTYEVNGFKSKSYKEWDTIPIDYSEGGNLDHFGGDLIGIGNKIPYFNKIGVNALYLNPIFKAPSHHKYDCVDYYEIDPVFGGNEALVSLSDELHNNNMKLMLDISVNHTGTGHKWMNREGYFDKCVGAFNNEDSEYREFYYFDEKNDFYRWMGVDSLSSLDYRSKKLRDMIYRKEDSVLQTYLRRPYNIDGWRLDVANNMARNDEVQEWENVWPELRSNLKAAKDSCYIIGEHWGDTRKYLNSPKWDAAMNYFGFSRPVRTFFNDIDTFVERMGVNYESNGDAKKLAHQFKQQLAQNPMVVNLIQFNFLDTHDVYRFHNSEGITFNDVKGAVTMLFTFPGTPSIYYGDEVGIDGDMRHDAGFRYPMVWNKEKIKYDYLNLYSRLANLRKSSKVLSDGGFKILYAEGGIIAYGRFDLQKAYITISSQENEDKEIYIPLSLIGVTHNSRISEYMGGNIKYTLSCGNLNIYIPSKETYLLEIYLK